MSRQDHIEKLEQQRLKLADDAQRIAANGEQAARDTASDAKLTAARTREEARAMTRDLASDARGIVSTAGQETRSTATSNAKAAANKAASLPRQAVREQPLLTFGAAAALGFAASLLLASRRKRAAQSRVIISDQPIRYPYL